AVPRGGESGRGLEHGAGIAVVCVGPCPRGADPLERELEALAPGGADVLEVAAGYRRRDEEDVIPHIGAVCVGARVEAAVRRAVVPAQLVGGGHDRPEGRVGAEREREGHAAWGSAQPSSTTAGARNPRRAEANTSCARPLVQVSPARGEKGRKTFRALCDGSTTSSNGMRIQSYRAARVAVSCGTSATLARVE